MDIDPLLLNYMSVDKAKQIVGLAKKFDKFVGSFKTKINGLLEPFNLEARISLAFVKKEKVEHLDGTNLNSS